MCCTLRNIKSFISLQLIVLSLLSGTASHLNLLPTGYDYTTRDYEPPEATKFETTNLEEFVINGPKTTKRGRYRASGKTKATLPTERRTAPFRDTYEEQCEFISKHCLRTYNTGRLCGRTLFNKYQTFENFCMLDYVNCRERYEIWQVMHMGQCYLPKPVTEFVHQTYDDDFFLDTDYVRDDLQWEW